MDKNGQKSTKMGKNGQKSTKTENDHFYLQDSLQTSVVENPEQSLPQKNLLGILKGNIAPDFCFAPDF